ncbi:prohibitin family protein, partial [bacterium]|nr:prohibitin family protein [bacterium]
KIGAAQFPVEKIIVEREKLKGIITELLRAKMVGYNITIENVNLVNIDLSVEFNKIVEQKQIEEQKIKTAEYKKKQAQQEKERLILQAEAQATKQRLLRQTVNKDIIALEWIKKWDGTLPQTMLGEGSVPLIDIRGKK